MLIVYNSDNFTVFKYFENAGMFYLDVFKIIHYQFIAPLFMFQKLNFIFFLLSKAGILNFRDAQFAYNQHLR